MERTEPVNPERRVSLLLKIWLYPNASAFKVAKLIPSASDYRRNYWARYGTFIMIICLELAILNNIFHCLDSENFMAIFIVLALVHGLPEFVFYKRITELTFDYYSYYNKALFYFFLIFIAAGFVGFGLYFNDQIGHVK